MNLLGLYTIKLPQFEGPFDLLLFFIERDEIDIYNIPISKITNDFLNYIKIMESLDIDLASEFIVMAASLMQIKAKMLLPRKPLNEEGEEIDPRDELIQRLIEYKKYKEAIPEFELLEKERSKKHCRGHINIELKSILQQADNASEIESISLYRLMSVFEKVMQKYDRKKNDKKAVILKFNYDMANEKSTLKKWIRSRKKMDFKQVFTSCKDRIQAIVRFLAILDMINERMVRIIQGDSFNNFWIESIDGSD